MDQEKLHRDFHYAMKHTKIVVPVKQTLFTFAPTDIRYFLVTGLVSKASVEMRKGKLTVERPGIITPSVIFERFFEGFDQDQREYLEGMLQESGFRGLQYKYKNETETVEVLSNDLESLLKNLKQEALSKPLSRTTVIQGVPDMWSLSLMKCVMELTSGSFPGNIKDLEEHGWYQ